LLAADDPKLNFIEIFRLLVFIYFRTPLQRLKLLWQYISDKDTPVRKHRIDLLAKDLHSRLQEGCRVQAHYFARRNYSRDLARIPRLMESLLFRTTPCLVVQPRNETEICDVLAFCRSHGLPVFPRGVASFAFGGAVPTRNGLVLDLSPMMSVLDIDPENKTVCVQPGARWSDIAAKLEPWGLALKTTPTSRFSSAAGWICTGGMGLGSYAHGRVYDSVLKVRIVRIDGTIEELDAQSKTLDEVFGSEGQFGILTEITLQVRAKPNHSGLSLHTFDSTGQAWDFIKQLTQSAHKPSHVVFFDKAYMAKENLLCADQTGPDGNLFAEQDSVLLQFDSQEAHQSFKETHDHGNLISDNQVAASCLWSDRYFPLKAQRIGPGLLGSEVLVPQSEVLNFSRNVDKLARRFRLNPTMEVIIGKEGESYSHLVIVSFSCDYSRSLHYALSLLFIQLLVRMAVRCQGHPYGIGIWNAPFVKARYGSAQLYKLKRKKRDLDPDKLLNPHKFFRIKGRFLSIPALALRPLPFRAILAAAHVFSPVLGLAARLSAPESLETWEVPPPEKDQGRALLDQTAQRCTSCGSCVSVCPAYHITRDELVAGRTKLRMAEILMAGQNLNKSEAHAPFQCLHCGLCEEVCQTHLPLRDCYLVLEGWLEERFGSPAEIVQAFITNMDRNRDFIKEVFGLDLPPWTPENAPSRVPHVERPEPGDVL
jgi:glycolate oxidase